MLTDFIDEDIQALEEELTTITGMLRLCITENAANTVTEETYRYQRTRPQEYHPEQP